MKGTTDSSIRKYLSKIGRKGGTKSRRVLSTEDARNMVRVREARRAFRDFYVQCFWYMRPEMVVTREDIPEIVRGLRKYGGRQGYLRAERLCR